MRVTWLAETAMLAHGWRRFAMLALAGALGALSVAPWFVLPALFVALPVWVWALDGAELKTGRLALFGPAFGIGFAFGFGYFAVALHWLGAAFFVDGGVMLVLMPFAIAALSALLALFWGVASALAHRCWSHGAWRIVTLATFLTAAEFARGHVLSGFPFDVLGYALTANDEMAQAASLVGVYGLTFVAALLAMTPALIWPADNRSLTRRFAPLFLSLAVIAAQIGYGNVRLNSTPVTERADLRLRLVQPVVREHVDWRLADPAEIITRLIALTEMKTSPADQGLAGVTHVVWPESSLPFFLSDYPEALARIGRMLPEGVTLLTGAPREELALAPGEPPPPAFNAILAIDTNGEIVSSYDKSHLVPFGEYLPFPELFRGLGITQFVPGANGWATGNGRRLMTPPGMPAFLALICYEAVFSADLGADLGKAEFLLNVTNDSWFDGSIGPAQHFHHARLRAVEEGVPMVRVANSGVTALIDPLGRVTARLAEGEATVLDVVPTHRLAGTVFASYRHLPLYAALALGLAGALWSARRSPWRKVQTSASGFRRT